MVGMVQVMMGMGGGATANLADHTVTGWEASEPNPSPPPATIWNPGTATYSILTDGRAYGNGTTGDGGSGTNTYYSGEWLVSGNASDCEVMFTVTSGTLSGGTTGTWLSCAADNNFFIVNSTSTAKTTVVTVQVRDKDTLVVLASCSITLTVSR